MKATTSLTRAASGIGTHEDDTPYVINGAFYIKHITVQEWLMRIMTHHS